VGRSILIDAAVAGGIACFWYVLFTHYNRRRGAAVLAWVQAASRGKGSILNPEWHASSSLLKATLNLSSRWFEDIRLTVCLLPRPLPLQWFLRSYRRQKETLTFEADMGFPPGFHLDVVRHRWSGHSGGKSYQRARAWNISRPDPVVLTTKDSWPAELSAVVNALTSWHDTQFMSVRFDPRSPHFIATVALETLSDQKSASALLGLFRELAANSSAKQH
jgi:hypothetical protein